MSKVIFVFLGSLVLFGHPAFSQTAGAGHVASIEAKVQRIKANQLTISQYKNQLNEISQAWRAKEAKLKTEIDELYKERDDIIADMKVGAKCSQCGKYKSQFEAEGASFQEHLGKVKGYAVPATTSELEATRRKYTEAIALKKVQLQNMGSGDKAMLNKQKDISDLEKSNEKLCTEITNHSNDYQMVVFDEAKQKHQIWTDDLIGYISNLLIAQDKVSIYKNRMNIYNASWTQKVKNSKDEVISEAKAEQNAIINNIEQNKQKISDEKIKQEEYLAEAQTRLNVAKSRKAEVSTALNGLSSADTLRPGYIAVQSKLTFEINAIEKDMLASNLTTKSFIAGVETKNATLKSKILQINSNITQKQTIRISEARKLIDKLKQTAATATITATKDVFSAQSAYTQRVAFCKGLQSVYSDLVVKESNRILSASQAVGCSVYNDIRGQVALNWNQVFSCVNALTTLAKPYSTNAFNSYCPGKSAPTYLSAYKSFLSGLSPEDKDAVRLTSNAAFFELVNN
ncbi:hypothetical protein ACFQZS_14185 [Mucilaginibacter calamicampi]|uniref:Chromosome partition protein Smc n=1 Tax=Mucilaginibacter calamicampi TaxID=1302352 RepID=A0ABW2Z3M0_9SPHI